MLAKQIFQPIIKFSDGIIILALPILLVILNSNWIFSPVTNFLPDAWFYTAFFRYFDSYAPVFPSTLTTLLSESHGTFLVILFTRYSLLFMQIM